MRDIKFKYYIQHDECGYITSIIFTLKDIEIGMLKEWLEECRRYSVFAICEFTGLHDKNGKEIYEGDIVSFTEDGDISVGLSPLQDIGSIEYLQGSFVIKNIKDNSYRFIDLETYLINLQFKILGNIYDNSDLLEV